MDTGDNDITYTLGRHQIQIDSIIRTVKELQDIITSKVHVINKQEELISQQEEEIRLLKDNVASLASKRNEKFYQKLLEQELGGGHKNTKYGITDITTDVYHVEIKHWCNFKECLGQLQAYNHNDDKKLIAAFFGDTTSSKRENVIDLFRKFDIEVWQLHDFDYGVRIEKFKIETQPILCDTVNMQHSIMDTNLFDWFKKRIIYKDRSFMRLKSILICYYDRYDLIGVKSKAKFRKDVESYIQKKYPDIVNTCGKFTINGSSAQGWWNLSLVDIESPDKNVIQES
uniref:Uncharacterized protein n=1 Tax=viral metagenome TaxID=1070528 RepID=A0A6C0E1K8_9ZZZZ